MFKHELRHQCHLLISSQNGKIQTLQILRLSNYIQRNLMIQLKSSLWQIAKTEKQIMNKTKTTKEQTKRNKKKQKDEKETKTKWQNRCDTIISRCDTIISRCDTIISRCDTIISRCDTIISIWAFACKCWYIVYIWSQIRNNLLTDICNTVQVIRLWDGQITISPV